MVCRGDVGLPVEGAQILPGGRVCGALVIEPVHQHSLAVDLVPDDKLRGQDFLPGTEAAEAGKRLRQPDMNVAPDHVPLFQDVVNREVFFVRIRSKKNAVGIPKQTARLAPVFGMENQQILVRTFFGKRSRQFAVQHAKPRGIEENMIPDIPAALKNIGQKRTLQQGAARPAAADQDKLRLLPGKRMRLPVEAAQRVFPLKEVQIPRDVLRVCFGHAVNRKTGLCRLQRLRKVPPGVIAHEKADDAFLAAEPLEEQLRPDLHPDGFDAALFAGQEENDAVGNLLPDRGRQRRGIRVFLIKYIPGPAPPAHQPQLRDQAAADDTQPDPDQGGQNSNAAEGEDNADQLSARRDGRDIAVTDRGHRDQRIPDRIPEGGKVFVSGGGFGFV